MIKKIVQDRFMRNNAILFAGTMTAAFLNYLYHPILSRMMTVQDFGEVQALLSLYGNLIVFLGIFSAIVLNNVANKERYDLEEWEERMVIISILKKIALIISVTLFSLIVIFSPQLQKFFQFQSFYPFISLAVILLIAVSNSFRRAYLRGLERFKEVAISEIISSSGRLLLAVLFVFFGWKAFGAITGIVLANLFVLWYLWSQSHETFQYHHKVKLRVDKKVRTELKFGLLVFVVSLTVIAFSTADVLIVKHFFEPELAGYYGGIATIARIVIFVTGSVTGVLIPAVKMRTSPANNQKLLAKAFVVSLLLAGGALSVFVIIPEIMIKILIGSQYLVYADLLPKLSILMFLVAMVHIPFFYYLALRRYFIAGIGLIGLGVIFTLSVINHSTMEMIIYNFIIGTVVMFILFFLKMTYSFFYYRMYARR